MNVAHKYLPNYTYEDYCQWEGQWELIEGIPYAMSPLPIPTILQPDLLVVCKKIEKKYLDFSPELVVEILSQSTAVKDRNIKKEIYLAEGVKYFLILDPQTKKIEIYEAINNAYSPVSISPNNFVFTFKDGCTANVDFKDIWD